MKTRTKVHLLIEADVEHDAQTPGAVAKAYARNILWQAVVANASNVDAKDGITYNAAVGTIVFSTPKVVLDNPGRNATAKTNPTRLIVGVIRRLVNMIVDTAYRTTNKLA